MPAALKIILDVLAFRLRKLEMANLAGAVAIMIALRLPWPEVLYRTAFAVLLNVFVYLNNDYRDIALDLRTPDKDQAKVRFMHQNMGAARAAQYVLLGALASMATLHSPGLMVALAAGAGICVAYSSWLKQRPYLDVLAMTAWGVAMPLAGTPIDRALGLCMAGQLGLMSAVFESIQVVRDRDADRTLGIRTTAVALGLPRTRALARALMVATALYGAAVLHPATGVIAAVALALPWPEADTERFWTRVKVVYGAAWLAACASVFWHGEGRGLLLHTSAGYTIAWLNWSG